MEPSISIRLHSNEDLAEPVIPTITIGSRIYVTVGFDLVTCLCLRIVSFARVSSINCLRVSNFAVFEGAKLFGINFFKFHTQSIKSVTPTLFLLAPSVVGRVFSNPLDSSKLSGAKFSPPGDKICHPEKKSLQNQKNFRHP